MISFEIVPQVSSERDPLLKKTKQYTVGVMPVQTIMEAVMTDAMYEIPSQTEMKTFEVDLNYAKSKFERTVFHQMKVVA